MLLYVSVVSGPAVLFQLVGVGKLARFPGHEVGSGALSCTISGAAKRPPSGKLMYQATLHSQLQRWVERVDQASIRLADVIASMASMSCKTTKPVTLADHLHPLYPPVRVVARLGRPRDIHLRNEDYYARPN